MTLGRAASSAARRESESPRSIGKKCFGHREDRRKSKTSSPCRRSASTRKRPTNPLAPVTNAARQTLSAYAGGETGDIGLDHHRHEPLKLDVGLPTQLERGLAPIADQQVDSAGRTKADPLRRKARTNPTRDLKRDCHEIANAVSAAGSNDEIVGLRLLKHQPHRAHVVAGITPVALRVEVPEAQSFADPV